MLYKKVNAVLPGTSVRTEDTSNSSPPAIRSPSLSASSVLSGQGSTVSAGRSLTWCHSTQLGHHGATGPAALVLWGDSPFLTPKQLLHNPCSGTSHLPPDLALFQGGVPGGSDFCLESPAEPVQTQIPGPQPGPPEWALLGAQCKDLNGKAPLTLGLRRRVRMASAVAREIDGWIDRGALFC